MSLIVKICGINDERAALAAADSGADAVGFVFARSVRQVTPETAARLAGHLPAGMLRVAVFLKVDPIFLNEVADALAPHRVQADFDSLEGVTLPPGSRAWPVLRQGIDEVDTLPPVFVYEGTRSGSGMSVDLAAAAQLARRSRMILAGGLDAGNVGSAIEQVRPAGVDVSSGVETSPGFKSPEKIHAFVRAARAAVYANDP